MNARFIAFVAESRTTRWWKFNIETDYPTPQHMATASNMATQSVPNLWHSALSFEKG
jgi:hypothetical protein